VATGRGVRGSSDIDSTAVDELVVLLEVVAVVAVVVVPNTLSIRQ
jgi:hypothetical protein